PDVTRVVDTIANPLRDTKQLVFLTDEDDLVTTCKANLRGRSDCFGAIIINDSPLTVGKDRVWNYTIRTDNRQNVHLPLQVALEDAITDSALVPNAYKITSISQETAGTLQRQRYQRLVISTYSVAFVISTLSLVYHAVGMI